MTESGATQPSPSIAARLPQLGIGVVIFGIGLGLSVRSGYGQNPWIVLSDGIALHSPLTIGKASISVGTTLVIGLVLAREPIGVGTIANVAIIGLAIDGTLTMVDEPASAVWRTVFALLAPMIVALGSGLYLGVRLGPGPRDGLMTALHRRGLEIWQARFITEALPFTAGALLGGTIGWGTVFWLVTIGPAVEVAMRLFRHPPLAARWTDVFGARGPKPAET